MGLSIKILNYNSNVCKCFINSEVKKSISENDKYNNITDLRVAIVDDKLSISWHDCLNACWKKNTITRSTTNVPINTFDGDLIKVTDIKNETKVNALIDSTIEVDKLYCYRIFTEFENSKKIYSGLKNIFFLYVYNEGDNKNE